MQAAQADIAGIFEYISHDNKQAAKHVVAAIEQATETLSLFPLSGRAGAVETTRELVIPYLPFIIVYRVQHDAIEIIAVFHVARNRSQRGA